MASASPSKDDYYIGIITALPLERAAVIAMLDARHNKPDDFGQNHDTNSYTWGRIGSHNVAIVSLATGAYGNTMATTTAVHMLYSLPNIKFGLMIGIGAGVANTRDIRLGDVVVSQPSGLSNGVFQYDFGKAKHNEWERTDYLARPPEVLLKALGNLQAEHEFGIYQAHDYFQDAAYRHGHWGNSYGFPQAQDRLFLASCLHQKVLSNNDCSKCDSTQIVERAQRRSPDQFQIHYGVIASGNSLVKDAEVRDKIAAMNDQCICIEMEAAGLMNDFPCLVIRGICDYADSHKNDIWQRYASATAASFTKELLNFVPMMNPKRLAGVTETVLDHKKPVEKPRNHIESANQEVEGEIRIDNLSINTTSQPNKEQKPISKDFLFTETTQLKEAIVRRDLGLARTILYQGADPNAKFGEHDDTVLHFASGNGEYNMLELLLDNGANLHTRNSLGLTPLHVTTCRGYSDAISLLIRREADIDAKDNQGRTPLHLAARNNDRKTASLLIDLGANIEATDIWEDRMIHIAINERHLNILKLLIDRKADIEARNSLKQTPLHYAVLNARHRDVRETVKLLLDAGANIEARDPEGRTTLLLTLFKGLSEIARWLLAQGALADTMDYKGNTSLHFTARNNDLETTMMLLEKGANSTFKNDDQETPPEVAKRYKSRDVANILG